MTFYNVIANYKHYVSHLSIEHDLFCLLYNLLGGSQNNNMGI